MAIGGVVINWASKTREAVADTDRLTRSIGGVQGATKKANGTLGNLGKAAGGAAFGIAGVAIGATVAFVDMAKAAYDDANAQKKLEHTLGRVKGVTKKAAEATGDWIDKMELATLVSDDELRVALGKLTIATGDLKSAQELATVAQDAAVGSGKQFAGISEALAKAAEGNTQALKRQFPFLDAGPDKVLTLAEALDQLKDKYGGAAEAAAENDVFGRLAVAWEQIKEAIGEAALPTLEAVSTWFGDPANITKIQGWIDTLEGWATSIGEDIKDKINDFVTWLKSEEGQQAIEDMTNAVKSLGGALETAVGWMTDLKGLLEWWFEHGPTLPNILGATPADPRNSPPGSHLNPDQGNAFRPPIPRNAAAGYNNGGTVININNPAPERATTSVASALRVTRPNVMV